MNQLDSYIQRWNLDPVKTMNWASEHGLISDLAVMPKDVADCDGVHVCVHLDNFPNRRVQLR